MNIDLKLGNCLEELEKIEKNSIDSIITDPPYELNFMGKGWDNAGVSFNKETWQKCYEVLKPGGYLLAFGGTRTYHRIACAIEDAGFEIRDCIMWLYGSGFPKSMNIGLAIDKKNGIESKIIGKAIKGSLPLPNNHKGTWADNQKDGEYEIKEAQNQWNGWGTTLKPAYEPIIVARKPFKGSLVDNVLENGVGGLNIDECRVGNEQRENPQAGYIRRGRTDEEVFFGVDKNRPKENVVVKGRFPSNVILTYDETDFDEVCGGMPNRDEGSASRYFKNCQYTRKDEDIWKNLYVNNVEKNLEIIQVIKDNIAQMNVGELLNELKNHYVKYVGDQLDLLEIPIVQDIAEILTWDFKIETSQAIQGFITNSKKCIQFQNLVQFVEKMDNIDTTQITQNLLKLFGYVKVVITNYIQGNLKHEQRRYIYTPKASKKDRDEGIGGGMGEYKVNDGRKTPIDNPFQRGETLRKNIHPTL